MITLIVVLLYLVVGTVYARHQVNRSLPNVPRPEFRVLTEADEHERRCDATNEYRQENGCDCSRRDEWDEAKRTVGQWEKSQIPLTGGQIYIRLLAWPLLMHHALMQPPVGHETKRERRMREELENARHIAEITAITNANQEVINAAFNSLEIEEIRE